MKGSKRTRKSFIRRYRIGIGLLLLLFTIWLFSLPANLFPDPTSTVVLSKHEQLLGARIADDGQWRFPDIDSVPDKFGKAVLLFEDRYFYKHPGINPVSMFKALVYNFKTGKRIGGSTITQQVIRLSRKNPPRSYYEKLLESMKATRLEVRYSKDNILRLYASHAPFGGNTVGLSAASWRYYGLSPDKLSWAEAATLAILPNAPSLIFPGKNEETLRKKRDSLLRKLYEHGHIDKTTYELSLEEPLPGKPLPLPDIAPHFTEKIRMEFPGIEVASTIDYRLQQRVNTIVENHYNQLKHNQIHNIAVLILDVDSREVLAYIGNSPTDREHQSYVDIIDKPRSSGSVLKPFLYAAMLDNGTILPSTLVSDIPTSIDGYSPRNYEKNYLGVAPADEALIRSLNIPAVRMLKDYGLNRFYNVLQKLNQAHINKAPDFYGLPIVVGGAESSLWDVTNAYAGMASTLNNYINNSDAYFDAEFSSPVYTSDMTFDHGAIQMHKPVLGASAIYKTFGSLKNLNRPDDEANWIYFDSAQPIAWKTGTSFGFKDAWAVGTTAKYAIGIWVGNATGEGRPGLIGIEAAAPILFDVLRELPYTEWFSVPYDDMIELEICSRSGHIAGEYCDDTEIEWVPQHGIRTSPCPYHKRVFLSESEQYRVNSSCYPLMQMKSKNWFVLPPVEEYYYRLSQSDYKSLPAYMSGCLQDGERLMEFIYPRHNQTVILPQAFDEKINEVVFKLAHRGKSTSVDWYLNDEYLGRTSTFHEIAVNPAPGDYILTAVDLEGNEVRERIRVKEG